MARLDILYRADKYRCASGRAQAAGTCPSPLPIHWRTTMVRLKRPLRLAGIITDR